MVIRTNRWGWKARATRLLLAPLAVAGPVVGFALAQSPAPLPGRPPAQKMQLISPVGRPATPVQDPSELLRLGRKAYNEGNLDAAQDYARQAAEANGSGRWGLFGDTPDALAKDIAAGRARPASPVAKQPAVQDPKELLRLGRKAYNEGNLDGAQEYLRQATEGNAQGRWGLFGDTPDALSKDISAARARTDKGDAGRLVSEARELYARPARNDSERVAYLHQASLKIDRACAAIGPSGTLAGSNERPGMLKREIDTALAKLNSSIPAGKNGSVVVAGNPFPGPGQSKGHYGENSVGAGVLGQPKNGGTSTDVVTVPAVPAKPFALEEPVVAAPAKNPAREIATKLMVEGRTLLAQQKVVEAQAKFLQAQKLNAPFSTAEENPDRCLQDCALQGQAQIDRLVEKGQEYADLKETPKAEAAFQSARELAMGLGVRTRDIDRELALLKTSKPVIAQAEAKDTPKVVDPNKPEPTVPNLVAKAPDIGEMPALPKFPDNPPLATPPVEPPVEVVKPLQLPEPIIVIAPPIETPKFRPDVPKIAEPKTEVVTTEGRRLIEDAEIALKNGQLDIARNNAIKALAGNHGVSTEAQQLLRSIDIASLKLKKKESEDALLAASESMKFKQYETAGKVLGRINPQLLDEEQRKDYAKLVASCETELDKLNNPPPVAIEIPVPPAPDMEKPAPKVEVAVQTPPMAETPEPVPAPKPTPAPIVEEPEPIAAPSTLPIPKAPPLIPSKPTKITEQAPPQAVLTKTPEVSGELVNQAKSLANIEVQQLRDEGLRAEEQALKLFNAGQTAPAMQLLSDHCTKVRASKISVPQQNMLLTRIETRLDTFRLMARQTEFYAKEAKDKKDYREGQLVKTAAEQQKHEEIAKRVQQINTFLKSGKHKEAEALALQTKQIEPDDATLSLLYELAKRNRRVAEQKSIKDEKEAFNYENGMKMTFGPSVDVTNPVAVAIDASRRNQLRGGGDEMFIKNRSPIEREIETKLERPQTMKCENAPLREVMGKFAAESLLNIAWDDSALADEGINIDTVTITQTISQPISLRNVLQLVLEKARLQYVVENDVIRVTTMKKAKGRMHTKVFSVMDLVTPIPDFAMPEHASLTKALERASNATPASAWAGQGGQPTPRPGSGGMGGGQLTGGGATPWAGGSGGGAAGKLEASPQSADNPLSSSAHLAPSKQNYSEQLKKLITSMVRPYAWEDLGGSGKIAYYDIGGALVVNQTADIIKEVQDLLDSLRRLQDLSVAVEVRLISLTEAFYERVGVDFQMNIKTKNTNSFERSLTTGQFRPEPFINDINVKGVTTGWNPATGGFTSDLDVPIRPNSYGVSVPPFGGYPGNGVGGLNLGLAFLNDIQVFMFLEAAAGDRRVNVMQAPKLTMFNGQTATVFISDFAFFTTGLQVYNVGGQFVYIPQNTPFPIGNASPQVAGQQQQGQGGQNPGINLTIQPVVSADRRFVRLTLPVQLSSLTSATVPLFPVTAFITPVFEGGSQGTPIPFTQFFQQPSFSNINVQSTVVVPDGGTVLVGGLKTLEEGRNEFGPPVLSSIPYLNRLFKNVGIGRETRHIMIMVSARIIIASEEEAVQTNPGGGN